MTIGGLVAGFTVAVGSGVVARTTDLQEDASLAAFYLISLALGVTIVSLKGSNIDLLHVLFGSVLALDDATLILIAAIASVSLLTLALLYRPLVLECVDPNFLRSVSRAGAPMHLAFLALVVLNLVGGFQALGTLLAVGMMMLPAAAARFWARDLTSMIVVAIVAGGRFRRRRAPRLLSRGCRGRTRDHSGRGRPLRRFAHVRPGRRPPAPSRAGPASRGLNHTEAFMAIRRIMFAVLLRGDRGRAARGAQAQEKLPVVATFSILGDFVRNVGGDAYRSRRSSGPNGDTHVYQPSPADAKKLARRQGHLGERLRFEGWIDRLIKASGTKATVVVATKGIKPREMADDDDGRRACTTWGVDPHAWQSIANAKIYVANIRDALIAADPGGKAVYAPMPTTISPSSTRLENEVKEEIAKIPPERRRIITTHDAFGYFGTAYGFDFIAPQGVSTETEASARDVAKIIRQIKAQKIPGGVSRKYHRPATRAAHRRRNRGEDRRHALFRRAFGRRAGPASTYIDMMRHNIRELSAALDELRPRATPGLSTAVHCS